MARAAEEKPGTFLDSRMCRERKRIAVEGEPIVVAPPVAEPIQVGVALRVIEVGVADAAVALESSCAMPSVPLSIEFLRTVSYLRSKIRQQRAPSIFFF